MLSVYCHIKTNIKQLVTHPVLVVQLLLQRCYTFPCKNTQKDTLNCHRIIQYSTFTFCYYCCFQKYQYNENDTLYCSAIPKPKSNFQINKVESPLSHKIFFLEQKPFISFFAFLDNSLYRRAWMANTPYFFCPCDTKKEKKL